MNERRYAEVSGRIADIGVGYAPSFRIVFDKPWRGIKEVVVHSAPLLAERDGDRLAFLQAEDTDGPYKDDAVVVRCRKGRKVGNAPGVVVPTVWTRASTIRQVRRRGSRSPLRGCVQEVINLRGLGVDHAVGRIRRSPSMVRHGSYGGSGPSQDSTPSGWSSW